jgi:hypothetical protein
VVSEGASQIHRSLAAGQAQVPRRLFRGRLAAGGATVSTTKPAQSAGAGTDTGENARYPVHMAAPTTDDLLAAIRRLSLEERLRLIDQAAHGAAEDTPKPAAVSTSPAPSLLGLMADDPDLVDHICSIACETRKTARMRAVDE